MHPEVSMDHLLQQCEAEKLHLSGAIQPYGALIGVDARAKVVTHASANLADFVGSLASDVVGRSIHDLPWFPADVLAALPEIPGKTLTLGNGIDASGARLTGRLIRGAGQVILELEAAILPVRPIPVHHYQAALLVTPYDPHELAAHDRALLEAFRAIAGYDRVMIYRFHEDWSGEVIAEITEPSLGSYLGLRFPASDIPAIARNLYMINPMRLIPDSQAETVPIIGQNSTPLDLTWSDLRSVSKVHLQYMRNMGICASFSVPVRVANRLWGLVACHHMLPKLLTQDERIACVNLTNAYALALTSHFSGRRLQVFDGLERRLEGILEILAECGDPLDGVEKVSNRLMEVMAAQGFAMAVGNDVVIAGTGPDIDGMAIVDDWFLNGCKETVVMSDHLEDIFPEQLSLLAMASGMVAIKARSVRSGWVRFYWFRPAQAQTVAWAGNPQKPMLENAGAVTLSPRRSFERWIETKSGYSKPWNFEEKMIATKFRTTLLRWI
jgi:light-regulated signal transduction histidine kinase (bacteriophytochrome)